MSNYIKRIGLMLIVSVACVTLTAFLCHKPNANEPEPDIVYTATEINLNQLPESIKNRAKKDMLIGSAYYYRENQDDDISYVLLSFGSVRDLTMTVDIKGINNGLYFSVSPVEQTNDEQVVYKLYKTNAASINTDLSVLTNPYLKIGSLGLNVGYLTIVGSNYYINPLEDGTVFNRVYYAKEGVSFDPGLYVFSYEYTAAGVQLVSADKIDSYEKSGYVNSLDADGGTVSLMFIGKNEIQYELVYDTKNDSICKALATIKDLGNAARAKFSFHFDSEENALVLDHVKIQSLCV